jgi:hypothetical protein
VPEDRLRTRLLDQARQYRAAPSDSAVQISNVWEPVAGDVVEMQNGWQLTRLDVQSSRRIGGRVVGKAKGALQRALHPLPAHQTEFNLAVNRIVTHLLRINERQAEAIARLEDEVEELREERSRRG